MGFRDILKTSFLESYNLTDMTTTDIFIAMLIACLIGLFIFLVYRIVTRKFFYSRSFSISLVVLAMLTTAIILTIQSSIVVSLGMVGGCRQLGSERLLKTRWIWFSYFGPSVRESSVVWHRHHFFCMKASQHIKGRSLGVNFQVLN